jgi:endonuclease/exonuclease/phosphatase family metal-dependent hydrolase
MTSLFAVMALALLAAQPQAQEPQAQQQSPDSQPVDIRVMSFNIRYGTAPDGENDWDKRKEFLVETIRAFNPDLLGTQETLGFQRDYLAKHLPGHNAFGVGRDDGKDKGEMMAVYWRKDRFAKEDGGHFWLSETPDEAGSKSWDAMFPRLVTWVKLRERSRKDSRPILLLNTHFDHIGRKARLESARLLRKQLAALGKGSSIIVTGDFNSGEGTEPYQALFGPLADEPSPVIDTYRKAQPMREPNEGTGNGFLAKRTGGPRIDWIACSRDWQVRAAAIDRTSLDGRTPSDHFPVTAILGR